MTVITRFAPSPTGHLHLGHVYAAWQAIKQASQGYFLLRIEDIDTTRCRPEWSAALLEDLGWLGFEWQQPVRIQSRQMAEYSQALKNLRSEGLLYPCFCTRADITREIAEAGRAPHSPDGVPLYPGTCRSLSPAERDARLAAGEACAWRLDMQAALRRLSQPLERTEHGVRFPCYPERFGDVVLARKDVPASYHLCAAHDDAVQGVTLVTRGEDLLAATDLHRLLQTLFGWPEPAYAHHGLLKGADGKRLAKRDAALTVRSLRESGASPQDIMERIRQAETVSRP
ncbi:tRNA glutamyl-Q(34) synthetase GluQRS [Granulibacter bethesdensis]|uniref:tRNA glutamyl-Q(34) synthetase GluQRS n=1 Tax=Granulibacter bethesdensis TaxID=364410 RepID=UPI00046C9570|nr:tRNA glutamyl-Q(34) synthetase GluQRS [Granulibacter bethesdensis]